MFDDGLLRAAELLVAKHVLQDGGRETVLKVRGWTRIALILIVAGAYLISARGQFGLKLCGAANIPTVRSG